MTRERQTEKPVPLMLRLPPALHAEVVKEAERQHRSLNAQVVYILEQWLAAQHPTQ